MPLLLLGKFERTYCLGKIRNKENLILMVASSLLIGHCFYLESE